MSRQTPGWSVDLPARPTDPEDAGPVSGLWLSPDQPGPPSPPVAAPSSLHRGSPLCRRETRLRPVSAVLWGSLKGL